MSLRFFFSLLLPLATFFLIGEPLVYVEILRRKKREAYIAEKSLEGEKISGALLNKVVVSSSDNNIECRIALGRAPLVLKEFII